MLLVLRPYREVDGGIGNYLFHLCHCILYAKACRATVLVPRPMAYATMNSSAVALDFSAAPSREDPRPRWWDGCSPIDRVPRSYDPKKIEVISGLLHGNEVTRSLGFEERYRCMQEHVRPMFDPASEYHRLEEDTLAIHIRSGDIFEDDPNPKYGQPPLSWYESLIERGDYRKIVVVAQTRFSVGGENPVLTKMRRRWPQLEVISRSPESDFHTIRRARHLALSVGTFAVAAAMLNDGLETLHVPRYERVPDENFSDIFPADVDLGFTQVDYRIGRYDDMYGWRNTPDQIALMLEHSIDDIAVSRRPSARATKNPWQPAVVKSVRSFPGR